jgi:hypothetical protein
MEKENKTMNKKKFTFWVCDIEEKGAKAGQLEGRFLLKTVRDVVEATADCLTTEAEYNVADFPCADVAGCEKYKMTVKRGTAEECERRCAKYFPNKLEEGTEYRIAVLEAPNRSMKVWMALRAQY